LYPGRFIIIHHLKKETASRDISVDWLSTTSLTKERRAGNLRTRGKKGPPAAKCKFTKGGEILEALRK